MYEVSFIGLTSYYFACVFHWKDSHMTLNVVIRAQIVWSWPTISSRTSQHHYIIAMTWHNDIVVLQYLDS